MNRQQRRAARKLGTARFCQTITNTRTGELYWFECSEDFVLERDGRPPRETWHGPFKTRAEVKAHQELTFLGPQGKVIEGGAWDPNWDKLQ